MELEALRPNVQDGKSWEISWSATTRIEQNISCESTQHEMIYDFETVQYREDASVGSRSRCGLATSVGRIELITVFPNLSLSDLYHGLHKKQMDITAALGSV
jgi:hypothetical protein